MLCNTMDDFEPYDCFDQMTEETCCSLGQQTRIITMTMDKHHAYEIKKKQEKDDNSSCLPQSLSLHHQQRMNRYDNHKHHFQSLQEDNNDDDIFIIDRRLLLQSPLSRSISRFCEDDKRSTRNDQEREQEETLQQDQSFFHDAGRFTGHLVSTKTSSEHYEQDTQSEEVTAARNVTPTFKSKQEEGKKKRKNHLDPGTHLASTLNFPYKSEAGNADGGYHSKRLKIWDDEADQGRLLEKHFNPEWQFQFLNEFYGGEASSSSRKNTMKSRTIHNQDDLHHNVHSQKINESKSSKDSTYKNKKNEERHDVVAKNLDNVLKEASLKLLAAMDLTDISRNKVFRIEEELNFDRKQCIL